MNDSHIAHLLTGGENLSQRPQMSIIYTHLEIRRRRIQYGFVWHLRINKSGNTIGQHGTI